MRCIDRAGNITVRDSGQDKLLRWMYTSRGGRILLTVLVRPWVSRAAGWMLDRSWSRCLIGPFVRKHGIDLSGCVKQRFRSYNDFFTRERKTGYGEPQGGGDTLTSPCDGKLSVYPICCGSGGKTQITVKDTAYTVESLLRSRRLAGRYDGGWGFVFRLTVDDYHRYCYVDDGRKSRNYRIPGVFHTVNPAANDVRPIYKENTREYSLLKSRHFKTVLMMEVGALLVGRITNYHQVGTVRRGQEKGRFEFGGSTVILLFQKDAVRPDPDLLENTRRGFETAVRMGEPVGKASGKECFDPSGKMMYTIP